MQSGQIVGAVPGRALMVCGALLMFLVIHFIRRDGIRHPILEAFRVEKRVAPGRTTAVDITPDRAGTFPFYCCLESGTAADTEKGRLIVAE